MTEPTPAPKSSEQHKQSAGALARVSLLIFTAILGGSALAIFHFRPTVSEWSRTMIEEIGGWGVALGFFVIDAFSAPIPNDIFSVFGRMGGMPFGEVVAWASGGSILGGCLGYWIGRYGIARNRWLKAWMGGQGEQSVARVRKHGAWFLAVAAITPLPYSLVCWAAGIVNMRFGRFFLVSGLRVIRIAVYLYLIEQGMVSFYE